LPEGTTDSVLAVIFKTVCDFFSYSENL